MMPPRKGKRLWNKIVHDYLFFLKCFQLASEKGDFFFHFFAFVQIVLGMGPKNDEEAYGYDLNPDSSNTGTEQDVQKS
jgi:hypothetical protein